MFSQVCVKNSVHRGVSVPAYTTHDQGVSVQGSLSSGVPVQGGSLSSGVSVQGGLCPGGSLSRGVSVWGESLSRGSLSRGFLSRRVSVQGGLCPGVSVQGVSVQGVSVQGVSVQGGLFPGESLLGRPPDRDPHMVTNRRYASLFME